jgi:hypothetical protein
MTGTALIRIARGLLHEDTFELMVAPAIADLQCDPTPDAYAAVWTTLLGALWVDFDGDLRLIFEDAAMLLALVVIQAAYYSGILLLLVAGMSSRQMVTSLAGGGGRPFAAAVFFVLAVSALPTMLCFWPPRRSHDHESELIS